MLAVREGEAAGVGADAQRRADIARGVQDAIVDTLVGKTARALDDTDLAHLVVAGGVSANRALRDALRLGSHCPQASRFTSRASSSARIMRR